MAEIDAQKNVYLFLHGKMDLREKAVNALVSKGFSKEKITMALPTKVGNVGDYMAMLWMPPNPDHIKIQQITKVEKVEPEGMIGLWKGVSKEDIEAVPLG
jgi:predicted metalloprotease